ncbi:glycoside hydrolase family 2 [Fulvivirga sp. M361]|uniref:sugar-binding domain-containing protein n=1 Tax=Fulvivirga sp. M361 TaxID=2594266 RepID=UPI00117B747E|nr:sugar-binding domain-containing protein [Fulvivirga sp. M361]TRX54770.1 glycoside hydrolase family 2 [Fulvivirga sp. M361]
MINRPLISDKAFKYFITGVLLVASLTGCETGIKEELNISLSGEWKVKLDPLDEGKSSQWQASAFNGTTIRLPGTLDDAGMGEASTLEPALNNYVLSNLTRKHQYIGKAWYQREVEIPESWQGKHIELELERVLWQSKVFVDGTLAGTAESLISSHDHDLSKLLTPGKHLLTVVIDNSNRYPLINVTGDRYPDPVNQEMAHAYTNHTQIKWNGILGDILLSASDKNSPQNLQVYPNRKESKLMFTYVQEVPETEEVSLELLDLQGNRIFSGKPSLEVKGGKIHAEVPVPGELVYWDEFRPQLYEARIVSGGDIASTTFGFKEIENDQGILKLNGRRIFLRGNLECAIFPLTGYPPMQKEEWLTLITQAKNYGLNHLRFHSWCPPKAAFEAADEVGFYLQVELPHWSLKVGQEDKTTDFLYREADKLLNDYGNHPSFILMSLGNELQGDIGILNEMVSELKAKDDRHLYTTTSFSFQQPTGTVPEQQDDFFITQWTDKGWIRGQGIFNSQSPRFDKDYSANSDHIDVPLISHEIGQYSVYPDLSEIPKYTGVLTPLNFIAVKQDLERKGMIDLAGDFTEASGKLAAMLYKEEIERAFKTPGFDGFQLLQLQDFPGQGTALVGLLNAFWESKGIISAEEFRKFNSPIVMLTRFNKAVYENGETFKAVVEGVNFLEDKKDQVIDWSIKNEQGNVLASGMLEKVHLSIGNNMGLGTIELTVNIEKAERWTVRVALRGTEYANHWPVWVYPESNDAMPDNVVVTGSFETALTALQSGKNVLLSPDTEQIKGIQGRFVPVFWSPVHFPDQPGTMGLLMDETHKAFNDFPTRSHTEWQWWDLCIKSRSVIIDSLNVQPIVRVVDNFVTNHQLANVFEARVGKGKLLFSAIDLRSDLDKRPVARQLRHSLLNYMASESFEPEKDLTPDELIAIKQ